MAETQSRIADIVLDNARSRPDATAWRWDDEHVDFACLRELAARGADALARAGCRPGERVAVLSRNAPAMLELYAACALGGTIAVPLNFRLAAPELARILESVEPQVLLVEDAWLDVVPELLRLVPRLGTILKLAHGADTRSEARWDAFRDGGDDRDLVHRPAPADPVVIVHTTGTTGRAKGAVLSQAGLYAAARAIADDGGLDPADTGLIVQPLFHVGALFLQLAHHLAGAAIRLERRFEPAQVWTRLDRGEVSSLQLAPAMLQALLDAPEAAASEAPGLRVVFYSTGPIREALLRRALERFGPVFVQHYGSTEAGVVTTLGQGGHRLTGGERERARLVSAGTAAPGVALRIVGDDGCELPRGEPGEVQVRTPALFSAYWHDEAATAAAFDGDWFRMGDIGYLDEDGFLTIVDRKRDMIVSGGENVYPREVEAVLDTHPAIAESAVFAVPDARWGERVHAALVPVPNAALDLAALRGWCRERIAAYKTPLSIAFVRELPRLANAKVDKARLRAPWWRGEARGVA